MVVCSQLLIGNERGWLRQFLVRGQESFCNDKSTSCDSGMYAQKHILRSKNGIPFL